MIFVTPQICGIHITAPNWSRHLKRNHPEMVVVEELDQNIRHGQGGSDDVFLAPGTGNANKSRTGRTIKPPKIFADEEPKIFQRKRSYSRTYAYPALIRDGTQVQSTSAEFR